MLRWIILATASCYALGQLAVSADVPKKTGHDIFIENCSRCHGQDGSSDTFIGRRWHIPDLRSKPVQKLTIDERIAIITHGKNNMPAHEKRLSTDEIKLVESYVRELGKPIAASK